MAITFPTVPSPSDTPQSLYQSIDALKQTVEIMSGNLPGKQTTPKTDAAFANAVAISKVTKANHP
jgi:hypothetical protein